MNEANGNAQMDATTKALPDPVVAWSPPVVGWSPPDADQSATLGKLAEALAKAQGEIENARKDSANPHLNRKYADLASVWEACREALSKNGLAVIQRTRTEGQDLILTTMLVHASGEFVRDRMTVRVTANGGQQWVQALGATITYARRYALSALVGVAPGDDDDGHGTNTEPPTNKGKAPQPSAPQTKSAKAADARAAEVARATPVQKTAAVVDVLAGETEASAKLRTQGEWHKRAIQAGANAGWLAEDVKNWLKAEFKCGRPSDVTEANLAAFVKSLGPADAQVTQQ